MDALKQGLHTAWRTAWRLSRKLSDGEVGPKMRQITAPEARATTSDITDKWKSQQSRVVSMDKWLTGKQSLCARENDFKVQVSDSQRKMAEEDLREMRRCTRNAACKRAMPSHATYSKCGDSDLGGGALPRAPAPPLHTRGCVLGPADLLAQLSASYHCCICHSVAHGSVECP